MIDRLERGRVTKKKGCYEINEVVSNIKGDLSSYPSDCGSPDKTKQGAAKCLIRGSGLAVP